MVTATILAEDFELVDGRVEITVPDVAPGCGYQIVRKSMFELIWRNPIT